MIGFSQTDQWFNGGFQRFVGDDAWELMATGGADIRRWADPNSLVWATRILSPCATGEPDRVVLTVSGDFHTNLDLWVRFIEMAVASVREKIPTVRMIVLQPVVGGPDGEVCVLNGVPVRASENQDIIEQAIATVVGDDVALGPSPQVRTCDDFRDNLGHLQDAARGPIARRIARFYRD